MDLGYSHIIQGDLETLNLVTIAKTLSLNNITFTVSRDLMWMYLFRGGGTIQPTTEINLGNAGLNKLSHFFLLLDFAKPLIC